MLTSLLPSFLLLLCVHKIGNSTVAVFGCGCIGLGVINGAKEVGASRIIAIDTNPNKEAWAKRFGATEFINPAVELKEGEKIQDLLVARTDGGLDYTFDGTGNVSTSFRLFPFVFALFVNILRYDFSDFSLFFTPPRSIA